MSNKNGSLLRLVLALGIITIFSGALLALVFTITKTPIEDAGREARVSAIKAVTPAFDSDPVADAVEVSVPGEERRVTVYPVSKGGTEAGAAVESYSTDGFSGEIAVMVGFDTTGKLVGYEVIQQAETPGLGAKMNDWFRDSKGNRSVIGRDLSQGELKVAKDGGDVDAITAATISSRAFLDAVNRAAKSYKIYRNEL